MLKVRVMGTKKNIKWFRDLLRDWVWQRWENEFC